MRKSEKQRRHRELTWFGPEDLRPQGEKPDDYIFITVFCKSFRLWCAHYCEHEVIYLINKIKLLIKNVNCINPP